MTALIVLAAIAAGIALLLQVPVDFRFVTGTGAGFRFRARWMFGAVRFGSGRRKGPRAPATPNREKEPAGFGAGLRTLRSVRRLLAIDGLPGGLVRLGRDLGRALRWRSARVRLRAGLEDPADTGELCGWVGAIRTFLPARSVFEFSPEFAGAAFEAEAEVAGRLWPARVVGALGRFVFSGPGWRAIGVLTWNRGN